jgi:hypothetical protein
MSAQATVRLSVCRSSRMSGLLSESAHDGAGLANPSCIALLSQSRRDGTIKSPARECRESDTKTDESRQGRHNSTSDAPHAESKLFKASSHERADWDQCRSVPSLSGLDQFGKPTRHSRAGLLIVPSLRDSARWCDAAWICQADAVLR